MIVEAAVLTKSLMGCPRKYQNNFYFHWHCSSRTRGDESDVDVGKGRLKGYDGGTDEALARVNGSESQIDEFLPCLGSQYCAVEGTDEALARVNDGESQIDELLQCVGSQYCVVEAGLVFVLSDRNHVHVPEVNPPNMQCLLLVFEVDGSESDILHL